MFNATSEVDLHNEASDILCQPGMSLELLEHKVQHHARRLDKLQQMRAPISVLEPVARLQRRFSLALRMKRNFQPADTIRYPSTLAV